MGECILIIEDNEDFRTTLMNLLKKRGYTVFGAQDCASALEMMKNESFALVVSDVRLPGPDGIELMNDILSDKEKRIIKTMVITGYADNDVPIKAIKLGVDDFLYKPFAMEVFLHSVDKLIKGYRLEKSVAYYKRLSILDGLTGLFNHRYFHETIAREMSRARRYQHPLSLLMIDIDDFKKFNDSYGHLAGDGALRKISQVFVKSFRSIDLAFRYGGEEFAILAPEQNKKEAMILAERIVSNVAQEHFEPDESPAMPVTVSIGVACYPLDADSKEGLIQKADEALYKAKELGKNRAFFIE